MRGIEIMKSIRQKTQKSPPILNFFSFTNIYIPPQDIKSIEPIFSKEDKEI